MCLDNGNNCKFCNRANEVQRAYKIMLKYRRSPQTIITHIVSDIGWTKERAKKFMGSK